MESAAGTHSLSSTTPHVCAQVGSHLPTSAVHWFFSDTSVYPEFSKNTWHTVSVCFAHEKTLPKISHSSQDLKPRLWPAELMATKVNPCRCLYWAGTGIPFQHLQLSAPLRYLCYTFFYMFKNTFK